MANAIGLGSAAIANVALNCAGGRGLWIMQACGLGLLITLCGCTYNPALGKWKIDQRTKETYVSYVDPLSSNIKKQTGNDTIEFLKDSIVVSGGGKDVVESGIQYRTQELEGQGGTEVRIFQPRKDSSGEFDIDVLRVNPDGKSSHLETPSEIVELKRLD